MKLILKQIREERGVTQEEIAEALGITPNVVSRFETGARRTNTDFLEKVAEYLNISVSELFVRRTIPVAGYIGAGAEFVAVSNYAEGAGFDEIEAPPGAPEEAVAVQIRGESMIPVYYDGDILVYGDHHPDIDAFLNRRCVVGLADERILVKTVTRGSEDGLYTLTSFNSGPIEDVIINWVAKIEVVVPR